MKKSKIVTAAEGAKKDGYDFITSVVKNENGKPLYNIVRIDDIIRFRAWNPASIIILPPVDGQPPRQGVRVWEHKPENSIDRVDALRKYCK